MKLSKNSFFEILIRPVTNPRIFWSIGLIPGMRIDWSLWMPGSVSGQQTNSAMLPRISILNASQKGVIVRAFANCSQGQRGTTTTA
ncbi:MAG TPA: hypothetical protein VI636_21585 [Candidatus Angelobacter sp.]